MVVEAERLDRGFRLRDLVASATPEISRFCQTVRRISPSPRSRAIVGEAAHLLGRELADRQHDADPVQARLLLRDARRYGPMRSNAGRGAIASAATRVSLRAELLLDRGEELLEAPGVEHVFQPRLVAVGAVAVLDEDAHDGVGDLGRVRRA